MEIVNLMKFVEDGSIGPIAKPYLDIYIGEANWNDQMKDIYNSLSRKHGQESALNILRETIAFGILLPAVDRTVPLGDLNRYVLTVANGYYRSQQSLRDDWVGFFKQVVQKDIENQEHRREILTLGVIDPIEYQPYTREAFNRIFDAAELSGVVTEATKQDITRRIKNTVMIYGGAVIVNLFTRNKDAIKKIVNWRTGYFLERAIFNVYTPDQILKIKRKELEGTNTKLVKKIRID